MEPQIIISLDQYNQLIQKKSVMEFVFEEARKANCEFNVFKENLEGNSWQFTIGDVGVKLKMVIEKNVL